MAIHSPKKRKIDKSENDFLHNFQFAVSTDGKRSENLFGKIFAWNYFFYKFTVNISFFLLWEKFCWSFFFVFRKILWKINRKMWGKLENRIVLNFPCFLLEDYFFLLIFLAFILFNGENFNVCDNALWVWKKLRNVNDGAFVLWFLEIYRKGLQEVDLFKINWKFFKKLEEPKNEMKN
jgi:hypothetical protein